MTTLYIYRHENMQNDQDFSSYACSGTVTGETLEAARKAADEQYGTNEYSFSTHAPTDYLDHLEAVELAHNYSYEHSSVQADEQQKWCAAHPDCDEPTSETTDEAILAALGRTVGERLTEIDNEEEALDSEADFRAAVRAGMSNWWSSVQEERATA